MALIRLYHAKDLILRRLSSPTNLPYCPNYIRDILVVARISIPCTSTSLSRTGRTGRRRYQRPQELVTRRCRRIGRRAIRDTRFK